MMDVSNAMLFSFLLVLNNWASLVKNFISLCIGKVQDVNSDYTYHLVWKVPLSLSLSHEGSFLSLSLSLFDREGSSNLI